MSSNTTVHASIRSLSTSYPCVQSPFANFIALPIWMAFVEVLHGLEFPSRGEADTQAFIPRLMTLLESFELLIARLELSTWGSPLSLLC